MAGFGDLGHGEDLTGVVLHPRQQDQAQFVAVFGDRCHDVLGAQQCLAVSRSNRDERLCRVEAALANL